jgi:hypothetical protein
LTRNDELKSKRLDDVTIAKVTITKEDLDHSLFEYEQHKVIKNSLSSQKMADFDEKNRSSIKSSFPSQNLSENLSQNFTRIEELENEFREFCTNKNSNIDINEEQSSIKSNLVKISLDFNETQIRELRKIFSNEFSLKQSKTSVINQVEKEHPVNLNSLYKWEQIDEPSKKSANESGPSNTNVEKNDKQMDIREINKKISIYSQHYCYFYKKKLKEYFV